MKFSFLRPIILTSLLFSIFLIATPAAGTEYFDNLKSEIKARQYSEQEALNIGIYTLPSKYRANNNLSKFKAYEADVDNDGAAELVVFRFTPDANEPCLQDFCNLTIYKKTDLKYTIFKIINVDDQVSGNMSYDFRLTDLDRNGIPELFFHGDSVGTLGYGDVTVYQWNGSDFSVARLHGDPMVSPEDIAGDDGTVMIKQSYMKNSLDGYPSGATIVYWPDIYKYENYKFVRSNVSFPDYYRKLSLESREVIKSIKKRTADKLTLEYKNYFLAMHSQIIRRCQKYIK